MKTKELEIDAAKHGQLLYLLNGTPSGDEQAKQLEKDLKEYLALYHEQLADIAETVRAYFETAEKIKRALPNRAWSKLVKRRSRVRAGPLYLYHFIHCAKNKGSAG